MRPVGSSPRCTTTLPRRSASRSWPARVEILLGEGARTLRQGEVLSVPAGSRTRSGARPAGGSTGRHGPARQDGGVLRARLGIGPRRQGQPERQAQPAAERRACVCVSAGMAACPPTVWDPGRAVWGAGPNRPAAWLPRQLSPIGASTGTQRGLNRTVACQPFRPHTVRVQRSKALRFSGSWRSAVRTLSGGRPRR